MIVSNVKTAPKETNALDLVRHRCADAAFGTERVRSGLPLPRQHGDHTGGEEGEWLASFPLHVPTETKSARPLFLARTTLLYPNSYSCPPPSKAYLKTCSSKLYLSFLEGGKQSCPLTNGKLAGTCRVSHLSERESEKQRRFTSPVFLLVVKWAEVISYSHDSYAGWILRTY